MASVFDSTSSLPPLRRAALGMVMAVLVVGCSAGNETPAAPAGEADAEEGAAPSELADGEPIEVGEPEPEILFDEEEIAAFEPPPVPTPDEVLPEVDDEQAAEIAEAASDDAVEILAAAPIDVAPTGEEIAASDDGRPRNSIGRLIALDEAASLACARTEMAIWALDGDDGPAAAEHLLAASEWAAGSGSDGLDDWSTRLGDEAAAATPDAVVLVAFLEACVAGGYEI